MRKHRILQALVVTVTITVLVLSCQDTERAFILEESIQVPDSADLKCDLSAGPSVISNKAGKETAYYGMADQASVRDLEGQADYIVCAHALYDGGNTILDNVRYLHDHGTKVILDMCWWDVWPLSGVVNGWPDMYKEDIVYGMNATESVKYRIRGCLENVGPEYVYGITLGEEEGPPSGFPGAFVAWYLNLLYDWMKDEYSDIKVFQFPAPYTWVLDPSINLKADGIVVDDYSQELDTIDTEARLLKEKFPDADLLFFVSAVENFGWFTAHTPTYLKQAVDTVLEYAEIVGFWVTDGSGNEGWETKHWMYNVSLDICDQIHAYSPNTIYADTTWFPDQFGNDTVTESAEHWYGSNWKDISVDPDLGISTASNRMMGDFSINLTRVNTGTKSFWWQPVTHTYGLPDYPTAGPYGVFNISGASRIRYFVKGVGWEDKSDPQVYLSLEKYNSYFVDDRLDLPDISSLLTDGLWHEVIVDLPLPPENYHNWDGYASQIRVVTSYSSGTTPCSILFDGWEIQGFDAGKVTNLTTTSDYVCVEDGTMYVEGNAVVEHIFEGCEEWYYGYSGTGQIEFLINGSWEAAPTPGDPVYEYLGGFRLHGGSFDYIQINALPPFVTIDSPSNGEIVAGNVMVEVSASDTSGIVDVTFSIDSVGTYVDDEAPYEWLWDTLSSPDGLHILNVTAMSNNGSVNYDYCYVTIDNTQPAITINQPENGNIINNTHWIIVTASDVSGVTSVQFYVEGALIFTDDSAPYEYLWDTGTVSDGEKNITCVVMDTVGNAGASSILVTVDNSGPLVSIHSLSMWSSSGLMAVNTSDPSGIDRVEFYLDGALQYTDYSYPYQWSWSGVALPDGSYTFSVLSYDILNHSSSASSGVQIDNTQPTLSVTWTPSGTLLSGIVDFDATASDVNGVLCVEFYIDGVLQYTDYSAPYEWTWDTTLSSDGNHSLIVIAVDSRGNSKQITFNLDIDNTGPSVSVNSPANQTTLSGPSAVTARVTVLDTAGIDTVLLSYYTGTSWITISMTPSGFYYEATTPVFPQGTTVLFCVFANDSLGNFRWSDTYECEIVDLTPPLVDLDTIPSTSIVAGIVQIVATASDSSGISMVILYVDGVPMAWLSSAPYWWDWNTSEWSDGFHTLRVWANDTWDNSDYLEIVIQTDNSGPVAVINSPVNLASLEGPITVSVLGTVQDTHGISTAILSYYHEGVWTNTTMTPSGSYHEGLLPLLQPGSTVQLRIYANDTIGNWGVSSISMVYIVDTTQPIVAVLLTPNWTVLVGSVDVLVTVTDSSAISSVVFYIDSIPVSTMYVAPYFYILDTIGLGDGLHTLRAWANDTWDNSNYVEIIIHTDNTAPSVSVAAPVNGTAYDAPVRVGIEVLTSDPRGLSHVLVLYNVGAGWMTEAMLLQGSRYIWNSSLYAAGTVLTFYIFVNDTLGNWRTSGLYECTVTDLSGPILGAPSLLPEVPTSFDTVTVSIAISDHSGVDTALLSYRVDSGAWVNVTMNLSSGYWVTIPAMSTGSIISYTIYANDSLGHWSSTPVYEYTVVPFDVLPPEVRSLGWFPTNPDDSEAVSVTVLATDPSGITNMTLSFHDGVLWHNITMIFLAGEYVAVIPFQEYGTVVTLKVYARDGQGNWGVTPLGSYNVISSDMEGPEIILISWSPSNPTEEDTVEVYTELTDANNIRNVILCYGQGVLVANVSMTFNGTGYVATIGTRPIGTQVSLCVYSCDDRDNWAIGEWDMYVVQPSDTTPPFTVSVDWTPVSPFSNESIDVSAIITDENPISLVLLGYFDGSVWRNLTMVQTPSDPDLYVAQIPAIGRFGTIRIWILAQDSKGNWGYTDLLDIVIQQIPTTTTSSTTTVSTSPITTGPPPDPLVIGMMGALVLGLPAGVVVGVVLSRLLRRNRGGK